VSKAGHQPSGITEGLQFNINKNWSDQQALAVFEMLNDLQDRIWNHYGYKIQAMLAKEQQTHTLPAEEAVNQSLPPQWPF
jgi:hypothetical protein